MQILDHDELEYKVSFSSTLKALIPEERDKYLAKASLADIAQFLPNIDYENNKDLLPVAFNVCTVNRVNKNGDGIGTEAALSFYKTFINKPINVEHKTNIVVGVILNVGFTEFGTDLPLTEEQVKDYTKPFNIVCGGVIWRHISKEFAALVEEASCEDSPSYLDVSASWEVKFKNYNIILLEDGRRNYEDGLIIDDKEGLDKYSKFLKASGGNKTGRVDNKTEVFRNILTPVLALGTGFTATPAGSVVGVATPESIEEQPNEDNLIGKCPECGFNLYCSREKSPLPDSKTICAKCYKVSLTSDWLKQVTKASLDNLTTAIDKNTVINTETINNSIIMFEKIEDITDEALKQSNASTLVQEFIKAQASKFETAIKEASEKYVAEKSAADKMVADAKAQYEEAIAKLTEASKTLAEIRGELDTLKAEKLAIAKQEAFNLRMASFDSEYDLTDEDRSVLGTSIKDMPEEAYAKFQKDMSVLMKNKKKNSDKKKDPEDKKEENADKKEEVSKASEDNAEKIIASAIDNADKAPEVPAGQVKEETLMSRFQKAFAPTKENYEIKSW